MKSIDACREMLTVCSQHSIKNRSAHYLLYYVEQHGAELGHICQFFASLVFCQDLSCLGNFIRDKSLNLTGLHICTI